MEPVAPFAVLVGPGTQVDGLPRASGPPTVSVSGVFSCCGFCSDELPAALRCEGCVIGRAERELARLAETDTTDAPPRRTGRLRWRGKDNR